MYFSASAAITLNNWQCGVIPINLNAYDIDHSNKRLFTMSDKDRVFVAVYFRQAITSDERSRNELQHAAYHWAIWVEPKSSSGVGSSYDVKHYPAYPNVGDPGGWRYNYREAADFGRSQSMLGRIMIGKLPKDVTIKDLHDTLQKVPIPREDADPVENCVTWTKSAIGELQQRNWVEQFNLDKFMDDALELGDKWYHSSPDLKAGSRKVNYTNRDM